MLTETSQAGNSRPEPAKPLHKCIWMACGLVTYKLCDLDFNCEICPFDLVIREQVPSHRSTGQFRSFVKRDPQRRD